MGAHKSPLDSFETVLQQNGCLIVPCGLILPPELPTAAWEAVGLGLVTLDQLAKWFFGDWWISGEHRHGDRLALVESERWNGPEYASCCNIGSVCRAFEISRRREKLSFQHHAEVVSLPRDQADRLLD